MSKNAEIRFILDVQKILPPKEYQRQKQHLEGVNSVLFAPIIKGLMLGNNLEGSVKFAKAVEELSTESGVPVDVIIKGLDALNSDINRVDGFLAEINKAIA